MSSISAINPGVSNAYVQAPKPAVASPPQTATAQVRPAGSDSDGDKDGSKGGNINTFA
ncbi:MAG: hypothetical protein ABSB19_13075 [Methylomonas sp.]